MKIEIRWKCYENAVDGLCVGVGMVMDGNVSCIGGVGPTGLMQNACWKGVSMACNGNEPDTTHASVGQFDDIDETILSMLEKDGRATLSQLSDATGLSISAVQSRVQKLERRNVILGYKAVIDDEKRGLAVRAYIAVTPIDYSKEAEIPAKLQDIEGIMSCDSVAGSPSYMLTVRAASPSKLEDLLNVIHQTVPVSTETTIVLQRYFSK